MLLCYKTLINISLIKIKLVLQQGSNTIYVKRTQIILYDCFDHDFESVEIN